MRSLSTTHPAALTRHVATAPAPRVQQIAGSTRRGPVRRTPTSYELRSTTLPCADQCTHRPPGPLKKLALRKTNLRTAPLPPRARHSNNHGDVLGHVSGSPGLADPRRPDPDPRRSAVDRRVQRW